MTHTKRSWQGTEHNERKYNSVHNALVDIILDGVTGVSPELPGHVWRMVPPEKADAYIARGWQVLDDFESQSPVPRGARSWMDRHIADLQRLLNDAEAVRSGNRPQKQTPESYDKLRKSLGLGETEHHVADFNTLDDLIAHARGDGATHASGDGTQTKLYFPRGGQYPYEEATVWRKESYWHAQGPGSRNGVRKLPSDARSIGAQLGRRAAEGRPTPRHVRDYEAVDNRDRHIAGPFKSYSDARQAAGTAGVVKFVPSRGKATEERNPSRSAHTPTPVRRQGKRH